MGKRLAEGRRRDTTVYGRIFNLYPDDNDAKVKHDVLTS